MSTGFLQFTAERIKSGRYLFPAALGLFLDIESTEFSDTMHFGQTAAKETPIQDMRPWAKRRPMLVSPYPP